MPALRDRLSLAPNLTTSWMHGTAIGKRVTIIGQLGRPSSTLDLTDSAAMATARSECGHDSNGHPGSGGRIDVETVKDEIQRLQRQLDSLRRREDSDTLVALLGEEGVAGLVDLTWLAHGRG